jgi:hypothetical protein
LSADGSIARIEVVARAKRQEYFASIRNPVRDGRAGPYWEGLRIERAHSGAYADCEMNSARFSPFLSDPEPPELGPGPRANVRPAAALNHQLDDALARAGLTDAPGELIRATILLWHDHLDAAHGIVQDDETKDGSYIHAILHRREPDYSNAKYWFRRVGQHPCFAELAKRSSALLKARGDAKLEQRLLAGGKWDALAFVDACEAAAGSQADAADGALLREIQRLEFEILLDYLSGEAGQR